ncbi:ATP-dependent DNA/RNA helicase [Gonapodya sp. JEL0774]|nr:ATP-dependent DNA/RNA helicase [Gonapodya sp. JEL0774]
MRAPNPPSSPPPLPGEVQDNSTDDVLTDGTAITTANAAPAVSFASMPLDARLQRALVRLGFRVPSPIQSLAIPLAMVQGRDIVANARTGSGKTAAYLLPIISKILAEKSGNVAVDSKGDVDTNGSVKLDAIRALILVPTKELAAQVLKAAVDFSQYCKSQIRIVNLVKELEVNKGVEPSSLFLPPHPATDILISTPSRLSLLLSSLDALPSKHSDLPSRLLFDPSHFHSLVLDECDLLSNFGYADDVRKAIAAGAGGGGVQRWLVSATAVSGTGAREQRDRESDWIAEFGKGAAVVTVQGDEDGLGGTVQVGEEIKELVPGTEQFGIRAAVVDEGLPVESRVRVIEGVGQGMYGVVLASDSAEIEDDEMTDEDAADDSKESERTDEVEAPSSSSVATKTRKRHAPASTSVVIKSKRPKTGNSASATFHPSRGLDFRRLDAVINFDLPSSPSQYLHRIGRTARGLSRQGVAISLWAEPNPASLIDHDGSVSERALVDRIKLFPKVQARGTVADLVVDKEAVDGFRYRVADAVRAVTKAAVREARVREVRREMLESERLKRTEVSVHFFKQSDVLVLSFLSDKLSKSLNFAKAHFSSNPNDLRALRSDRPLHPARVQSHLKHVPSYLAPKKSAVTVGEGERTGGTEKGRGRDRASNRGRATLSKAQKRRSDPLKSFALSQKST